MWTTGLSASVTGRGAAAPVAAVTAAAAAADRRRSKVVPYRLPADVEGAAGGRCGCLRARRCNAQDRRGVVAAVLAADIEVVLCASRLKKVKLREKNSPIL